MELRQLRYFAKAAETLNFSDAAKAFDFGRKDLFLFRRSGKADMLCAGVNAQRHALLRFTGGDSKLNRERRSSPHHGLACLEQMPCLCRRARHQGLTAHAYP